MALKKTIFCKSKYWLACEYNRIFSLLAAVDGFAVETSTILSRETSSGEVREELAVLIWCPFAVVQALQSKQSTP